MTDISEDGLAIQEQNLSNATPSSEDHNRLYHHNGSAQISLVDGSTTYNRGYYIWNNNQSAWVPLSERASIADSSIEAEKISGAGVSHRLVVDSNEHVTVDASEHDMVRIPSDREYTVNGTLTVDGSFVLETI